MKFWVGITDGDWFAHLSARRPDEVNFWQPGARAPRTMEPGWPFLFKLHSPKNFIVGGGFFIRFSQLPCFLAWEAFGEKNGATSLRELIERVARYRHAPQTPGSVLGCNILNAPFFFLEHEWIPIPKNWPANVQRGQTTVPEPYHRPMQGPPGCTYTLSQAIRIRSGCACHDLRSTG